MSSASLTPSICNSCSSEFGCGAKLDGCWCTDVKLAPWQAEIVRNKFDDCLCPACLAKFAAIKAIRVTYPDGRSEIIEDAVRVDSANFHEGMFDFYDESGNLLRQIDLGSGISWDVPVKRGVLSRISQERQKGTLEVTAVPRDPAKVSSVSATDSSVWCSEHVFLRQFRVILSQYQEILSVTMST